jgi:hypothetical protein
VRLAWFLDLCFALLVSLQEAYAEAEADLAAEARGKKGGKRRKAAAAGEGGDDEDAFFSGLALQDKLPKFVELLKFKARHAGGDDKGTCKHSRSSASTGDRRVRAPVRRWLGRRSADDE